MSAFLSNLPCAQGWYQKFCLSSLHGLLHLCMRLSEFNKPVKRTEPWLKQRHKVQSQSFNNPMTKRGKISIHGSCCTFPSLIKANYDVLPDFCVPRPCLLVFVPPRRSISNRTSVHRSFPSTTARPRPRPLQDYFNSIIQIGENSPFTVSSTQDNKQLLFTTDKDSPN